MISQLRTGQFSISGSSHRIQGREGQDSVLCHEDENFKLLLVADGIGSVSDSKVGSMILVQAVRRIVTEVANSLADLAEDLSPTEFGASLVTWLNHELREELLRAHSYLGGDGRATQPLAATLLGCFMNERATVVFGCGDGVLAINTEVFELKASAKNRPDLPAYAVETQLISEGVIPEPSQNGSGVAKTQFTGQLKLLHCCRTSEVWSVMVATDGVRELIPVLGESENLDDASSKHWLEQFFQRSITMSSNGSRPNDDATAVGAWRTKNEAWINAAPRRREALCES